MDFKWLLVIFFSILGASLGSLSNYLYKYYMLGSMNSVEQSTGPKVLDVIDISFEPKVIEIVSILSLVSYLISCSICIYIILKRNL